MAKGKGIPVTCGSIITAASNVRKYEEKHVSLPEYIKEKVKLMHEFGYNYITNTYFNGCRNEIQVDQKAHTVLFGR